MLCLDTNIVIGLLTGRQPAFRRRYNEERLAEGRLTLSAIVLFELRFGAANSERPERNGRVLDEFLAAGIEIFAFDAEDAAEAGAIRAHLKREGTPIGPFDILIAAQARRRQAALVIANVKEFARVPGLSVIDWGEL